MVRPEIRDVSIQALLAEPWDSADVTLSLSLEAGENAGGKTVRLEYVRLFSGSSWRTNNPALELQLRLPDDTEKPFDSGEVREVCLEGYTPNDDLYPYCGQTMRLLIATRTSGAHEMAGAAADVLIECVD